MSSRAGSVRVLEQELMLEAEARRLPSGKCRLSLGARKCSGRECKAGKKRLGGISSRNHVVRCAPSCSLLPPTPSYLREKVGRTDVLTLSSRLLKYASSGSISFRPGPLRGFSGASCSSAPRHRLRARALLHDAVRLLNPALRLAPLTFAHERGSSRLRCSRAPRSAPDHQARANGASSAPRNSRLNHGLCRGRRMLGDRRRRREQIRQPNACALSALFPVLSPRRRRIARRRVHSSSSGAPCGNIEGQTGPAGQAGWDPYASAAA